MQTYIANRSINGILILLIGNSFSYMNTKEITDVVDAADPPDIPTRIKPTCAIEENARKRLKLFCLIAKRFPMIIVSSDKMNSILYQDSSRGLKTVYNTDTNTKITA